VPNPPPPEPSPTPPRLSSETPSGVYRVVHRAVLWQRVQWGFVGACLLAIGGLLAWNLDALKDAAVGSANAQAQSRAAHDAGIALATRLEAIDSGTRLAIERMEAKADAREDRAEKSRAEDRALLLQLIRKVDKL